MDKQDFERQLHALVPQPDPEITAALFSFGQELGQEDDCDGVRDLLNSMNFVSRHFSAATAQGVYEIIQHGPAALPGEMVAAAVYLENGSTPQAIAEMADVGSLMCFHRPRSEESLSPLAVCVLTEGEHSQYFHTLHFGAFDPDTALRAAQQYAHDRQLSVTDALLSLTTDMTLEPRDDARKLLVSNDPDMTLALYCLSYTVDLFLRQVPVSRHATSLCLHLLFLRFILMTDCYCHMMGFCNSLSSCNSNNYGYRRCQQ